MKRILLTVFLCLLFSYGFSQSDSILDRKLLKLNPLKILFVHPNVGIEYPLSTYHHLDLHVGVFPFFNTFYHSFEFFSGIGFTSTFGYKKFSKKWKRNSHFYLGPSVTFRNFRTPSHTFKCGECNEKLYGTFGKISYTSLSLELKTGIQNAKRSKEYFTRIGLQYNIHKMIIEKRMRQVPHYYDNYVERTNYLSPVITLGFYLTKPVGR